MSYFGFCHGSLLFGNVQFGCGFGGDLLFTATAATTNDDKDKYKHKDHDVYDEYKQWPVCPVWNSNAHEFTPPIGHDQ